MDLRPEHNSINIEMDPNDPVTLESFGFNTSHTLMAKLSSCWSTLAESMESFGSAHDSLHDDERTAMNESQASRKIRIGMAGATSSGKSTLVNALLHRELSPVTSEVCTGTVVEFAHYPNVNASAASRVTINFFNKNTREKMIKRMHDEMVNALQASAGSLNEKDRQRLKHHQNMLNDRLATLDNIKSDDPVILQKATARDMQNYVCVAKGNSLPEFVEHVTVQVPHPLLQFITIVDMPGTQDMLESRAEVVRNTLEQIDAWIYLVDASQTIKPSVVDDIRYMHASNRPGMIVFTKPNLMLEQVDSNRYGQELSRLRAEYQHYTNGSSEIPAVNVRGYWDAVRMPSVSDRSERRILQEAIRRNSYGVNYVAFVAPEMIKGVDTKLISLLVCDFVS